MELVVIDPVSAFFDVGARGGRARAVLSGLQALAREHSTAIVLVAHLRTASTRATLDVAGADGLVAAARMVWVVKRDPNDPRRRLFLPAKNNLDDECPGFAWRLMGGKVHWEPGRVECGPAGELVDDLSRARGRREALASAFIADFLKDGPRMWGVIEHRAKLAGHRPRTLERARGSVAETFKLTGADGRWLWRLMGDTRDWSEGDVTDMLSGDPVGRRAAVGLRSGSAPQASRNPRRLSRLSTISIRTNWMTAGTKWMNCEDTAKLANMRNWPENRGDKMGESGQNRRSQRENACSPVREVQVAKLAKLAKLRPSRNTTGSMMRA